MWKKRLSHLYLLGLSTSPLLAQLLPRFSPVSGTSDIHVGVRDAAGIVCFEQPSSPADHFHPIDERDCLEIIRRVRVNYYSGNYVQFGRLSGFIVSHSWRERPCNIYIDRVNLHDTAMVRMTAVTEPASMIMSHCLSEIPIQQFIWRQSDHPFRERLRW